MSRNKGERREVWLQIVAQQEQSGASVRSFCNQQGVNEHSFYSWRQRLRRQDIPASFALVQTQPQAAEPLLLEIALRSGHRLRLPADTATLRLVLAALES